MTTTIPTAADVRAWVVDVDGCLVSTDRAGGTGGVAIPGAIEFIDALHAAGHRLRVVTNASQRAPRRYAQHLRDLGFDIRDDEFMTAGSAAAAFLARHYAGRRVLVVGEDGIVDPLTELGMETTADDPDEVAAVVVGAVDALPARQLDAACRAVADGGADLYVTVDTAWFHGGRGRSVCTSAAIAHAIEWVTGVPPIVLGKPSDALAATLLAELGGDAATIAVVGDAPAEIDLADEMGALAITVLTGALDRTQTHDHTGLVLDSVAELLPTITPADVSTRHFRV